MLPLQLWSGSETENRGIQKLTLLLHCFTSPNDKIPKVLSSSIFPLPVHFVEKDITKGKYYYFHFKVFFCSTISFNDLCLAINSERNFSYLHSMFPPGQNYTNLCQNPAINLNVKVAPKRKFENLPRILLR